MTSPFATYELPVGPLNNGRPTMALWCGDIARDYMAGIAFGASDYATQHGFNLIAVMGGPPNNLEQIETARDQIFSILDPAMFDGLIVALSTLAQSLDGPAIQQFLLPFKGKPIATIGMQFEDAVYVTADNSGGMRQMLKHLIEDHGYRKIVFAMGASYQPSADEKLKAYIDTLANYGIAYDPRYVIRGPRGRYEQDWCTPILFDERKLEVDAIVSVNDNQAMCIIHSLQERGFRVPQDIAVTGCMNIPDASVFTPSLTTVQEPLYQLGWQAARALAQQLSGRKGPATVKPDTRLLVRQSCGCSAAQVAARRAHLQPLEADASGMSKAGDAIVGVMKEAALAAVQSLEVQLDEQEIAAMAELFAQVHSVHDLAPALLALEEKMDQHLREDVISAWLAILPALQRYLRAAFLAQGRLAEGEVLDARFDALSAQISQKAFNYRFLVSETYVDAFRQFAAELKQDIDPERLRLLLVRDFKIRDCYLSLYEGGAKGVATRSRSLLAIQHGQLLTLPPGHEIYPAADIVPPGAVRYHQPYSLFVFPLTFGREHIGNLVLDPFVYKGPVFENMVALASGALKNKLQITALTEAEERFTSIALAASDWLWEVDAQCRYTFCSAGVERVLGYSAESMIGRSLFDFVLPSESDYLELVQKYLIPYKLPLTNLEHLSLHRDGREVSLIISGRPMISNGELVGYCGAFKDTTEVRAKEERIRQLAYSDTLTGLPNRALFQDRLQMMVASSEQSGKCFAVLFLDLDRFKNVNDTLGHEAGDLLLKEVAQRLKGCVRESDTLARLGGDEFTAILSTLRNDEDVATIAARMVQALAAPFEILGNQVFIGVSIGIAISPHDGDSALLLHKHADEAMYKAKEQGRNCFVFYDKRMGEKSARRLLLETALHQAIQNQSFELQYQLQINAQTHAIVGAEALLCLATDELGSISPGEFIPLAEEIGLIEPIGLWVFATACKQAKAWRNQGYAIRVAVNVSALQLKNSQLAPMFIGIVEQVGLPPEAIAIEITEHAVIDNQIIAKQTLEAFRSVGFKVAIDDFGTGYSSLSSLKKFPIDTIKIDGAFINDCLSSEDSANIVSAIVQIAKSLRMSVVAEGVETPEQLAFLNTLGCHEAQGYLIAKPQSPWALSALLRAGRVDLAGPEPRQEGFELDSF